jgi:hypothetical protein
MPIAVLMGAADGWRAHAWRHSELVLVDAELAARAREVLEPAHEDAAQLDDAPANEALRRLTELSDVEPMKPRRARTRIASLAFAATAWALLAVIAFEMQPWRV